MPATQLPLAENVQATATSGTSIRLSWTVPPLDLTSGSIVKFSFCILRRRKDMASFVIAHEQEDTYTSHELTGLRPYCDYEFVVQTQATGLRKMTHKEIQDVGLPTTEPVCCRTLEGVPMAPRKLSPTGVTTDTITFTWKPPLSINGLLKGYRLYFDQEKAAEFNLVELPPSASSYTAKHLFPATSYRFQVLAFTSAGEGPCTAIVEQRTRDSALNRFKKQGGDDWVQQQQQPTSDDDDVDGTGQEDETGDEAKTGEQSQQAQATTQQPPRRRGFRVVAPTLNNAAQKPLPTAASREDGSSARRPPPARRRLNEDEWRSMFFSKATSAETGGFNGASASDSGARMAPGASHAHIRNKPSRRPFSVMPPVQRQRTAPSFVVTPQRKHSPPKRQVHPQAAAFLSPSLPSSSSQGTSPSELVGVHKLSRGVFNTNESVSVPSPASLPLSPLPAGNTRDTPPKSVMGKEVLAVKRRGKARTIRGKKHGVRKTLQHLQSTYDLLSSTELSRLFEAESKQKRVVLYVTSTTGIRETYQACEEIKAIFYNLRVRVELRNVAMDKQAKAELEKRLPGATVPQVFLEGLHLGDAKGVKELNETGELRQRLQGCEERPLEDCTTCGGQGYVLCTWCQGSKRSLRHAFAHSTKDASLKCTVCNENALQRCPDC